MLCSVRDLRLTLVHYEGVPDQVPNVPAGGYGYNVRTDGLSSKDDKH